MLWAAVCARVLWVVVSSCIHASKILEVCNAMPWNVTCVQGCNHRWAPKSAKSIQIGQTNGNHRTHNHQPNQRRSPFEIIRAMPKLAWKLENAGGQPQILRCGQNWENEKFLKLAMGDPQPHKPSQMCTLLLCIACSTSYMNVFFSHLGVTMAHMDPYGIVGDSGGVKSSVVSPRPLPIALWNQWDSSQSPMPWLTISHPMCRSVGLAISTNRINKYTIVLVCTSMY
jgi:hypothetical protein